MIDYGLKDRVAIVTGANNPQGIGAATALALAKEGARVVLVYKRIARDYDEKRTAFNGVDRYFAANAGGADAVGERLLEMGADYLILERDISSEEAVKEIYSTVIEKYGRVDILVNNAADGDMEGVDTIEKITQVVIDDTFAVNVRGSILMTREFVKNRGDYGRIINLSTDASQTFAGQITYGASKATLEALTRSIALEVAQYGITVNCVAPGVIETDMTTELPVDEVKKMIPMKRFGKTKEVASLVNYLMGEDASYITGQVISVNGGLYQ